MWKTLILDSKPIESMIINTHPEKPSFLTNKIGAQVKNFECQINSFQDFLWCILEIQQVCFVISCKWVWMGVGWLVQGWSHNHMANV
jgi:hypothetical protein